MSQCINPKCLRININHNKFCNFCGFPLLLVKRYRPIRFLGQGGFGRTFIALDELLPSKPQCVIKQFFPQVQGANSKQKAKEMFEKEAQHLERLGTKFEQIPTLLAYFEENNYQYLVQEFIDGLTLEQELEKNGKFSQEQVKQVLIDLLFILDFLHQNKVIHRDIKPSNIIRRSSDKKLFLVDFGVSKLVEVSSNINSGTIVVSSGYTAPEQLQGKSVYSSDFYSLGVTCLELLTGQSPLNLYDVNEGKWLWRNYLDQNKIDSNLGKVLDKLIEQLPDKRYQSVDSIMEKLGNQKKGIFNFFVKNKTENKNVNYFVNQNLNEKNYQTIIQYSKLTTETFSFETVFINDKGLIEKKKPCAAIYFRQYLNETIYIDMINIPGGFFLMGSPKEEKDSLNIERPQHSVCIPSFWMSKYPITQEQWTVIMKSNPSRFKGSRKPVDKVTWHQSQTYCKILSQRFQKKFRLPSEGEWEYACRAGTNSEFYCGQTIISSIANYDSRYSYKQEMITDFINETTEVGLFPPNGFGLYDMCGNVWEWCQDSWHDNYENAPTNEKPWINSTLFSAKEKKRVRRGGSWRNKASYCRSSSRSCFDADSADITLGFRIVMENSF